MNNEQISSGYWVTAIIVVVAIAAAVYWYTATDMSPLIPNTGALQSSSSALQYGAE